MSRAVSTTGLRGETEFLRRYNNRVIKKQKKIRTIRVKGLHIFLTFLVLGAAAFAAYHIAVFVLTWEKLNVKNYVLIDKPTFRSAEVEQELKQFKGNILTINFSQIRQKMLAFNEVKDVFLSRKLPSTVEIRFILRKPVFQVAINGNYNIMDMEGVILHTVNESSNQLIAIKDIEKDDLEDLVPYLTELHRIRESIEYVSLKKPYGILLKLKGLNEIFYPGESDFAKKINYYLDLRKRPLLKNYLVTSVDLRFKDRFYFEFQNENENETEEAVNEK